MFGPGFRKTILPVAVAAALAFSLSVLPAGSRAATIGFYDDAISDPAVGLRGTLECTSSGCAFEALRSETANFDPAIGGLFNPGPGRNVSDERDFANANRKAGDAMLTGGTRVDGTSGSMNFSSSALYIVLKIGGGGKSPINDLMLIRNTSSGLIAFSWDASGTSAGLSHYTEFGQTAVIPLPAGGLLLITALGGLGIMARRRRKAG